MDGEGTTWDQKRASRSWIRVGCRGREARALRRETPEPARSLPWGLIADVRRRVRPPDGRHACLAPPTGIWSIMPGMESHGPHYTAGRLHPLATATMKSDVQHWQVSSYISPGYISFLMQPTVDSSICSAALGNSCAGRWSDFISTTVCCPQALSREL